MLGKLPKTEKIYEIWENSRYERPEGEINLRSFLYTDIYEEGMVERVAKCAEDTRN